METVVLKCNNKQLIEEKQDEDKDFPLMSLPNSKLVTVKFDQLIKWLIATTWEI